jgi:hypothetical protein
MVEDRRKCESLYTILGHKLECEKRENLFSKIRIASSVMIILAISNLPNPLAAYVSRLGRNSLMNRL